MAEEAEAQSLPHDNPPAAADKDELSGGEGGEPSGGAGAGAAGEDELSLPKATVYKLIAEMLPPGVSCPRETRDLLITCCVEFIHLVSGEANEICEKSGRKTINPDHVVEALRVLGFADWVDEVLTAHGEATEQAREKQAPGETRRIRQWLTQLR